MQSALISIIDDDDAMRLSLVDLMRSAGYRALAYASAEEFLDAEDRISAGCIITDIQMPGLNGFELKRRLDQEGSRAPVIMITARADVYFEGEVDSCGAICLLRKPFDAEDLFACVQRSLDGENSSDA